MSGERILEQLVIRSLLQQQYDTLELFQKTDQSISYTNDHAFMTGDELTI
jgi:hypothetical protein